MRWSPPSAARIWPSRWSAWRPSTKRPLQRIGLSATQRPLEEVARFLGGVEIACGTPLARHGRSSETQLSNQSDARTRRRRVSTAGPPGPPTPLDAAPLRYRPVTIVNASAPKQFKLSIEVPVEDMARLGAMEEIPSGPASQMPRRVSIWNAIHPRLLELIRERNSTILFVNSRQVAERLAGALNELAGEPIARAHHGSLAAAQRSVIEEQLKAGQIRALCATSTLELGIDMGAVDLVIQIEAPPSVASGMQRIGRAGHHVDAVSEGILFPKYRADLVACAAVTRAMHEGHIESTRFPRNPLDVLAQQLVAIVAHPPVAAAPFAQGQSAQERQASEESHCGVEFADWESALRSEDGARSPRSPSTPSTTSSAAPLPSAASPARPSKAFSTCSAAATPPTSSPSCARASPGTASATSSPHATAPPASPSSTPAPFPTAASTASSSPTPRAKPCASANSTKRWSSSRHPNETFILGASTWRIVDITHDRVLVTPAPGEPGKMPFWKGDGPGRPLEFGRRIGALVRELRALPKPAALTRLVAEHDLDPGAAENLLQFLADQDAATGAVPDDRTIVIERVPRRTGRLARLRAHALRQPHPHSLGHGRQRAHPRRRRP